MRKINLGDTIYFHFAINDSDGSGADGATHVYDVRLAGAAASAAPVLSGSATLLTHANYPDGCLEVEVAATEGNGFAINSEYAVFATAAISTQNPTGFVGSFQTETPGSVTAHFTDRTTDGNSTVQTLSGKYTVHVAGVFDGATLAVKGGTVGQTPSEFTTLRVFTAPETRNIDFAGDIRFEQTDSDISTEITAIVQQVLR